MSASAILELSGVVVAPGKWAAGGLRCASLQVASTELVAIRAGHAADDLPFCAVAAGLCAPDEGRVRFLGEDWAEMNPFRQCERRGSIGRVFESEGWISNLTIYENVALAQRHHTRRPDDEIRAEAVARARQAGVEQALDRRPAALRRNELKRAQWVRAFMGQPRLVLLERPLADTAGDGEGAALGDWVAQATARGCPVVWIADEQEWRDPRLAAGRRVEWRDGALVPGGVA